MVVDAMVDVGSVKKRVHTRFKSVELPWSTEELNFVRLRCTGSLDG